jgi:ribonuclease HII
MPDLSLEKHHHTKGIIAGVDEAGRGPWAGPVVAGAVYIPPELYNASEISSLNDSKKLSANKREFLYSWITEHLPHGIGIASAEEVDQFNILQATFLAMKRAVNALPHSPAFILVDGNKCPDFSSPSLAVVKGDALSCSIAAASILAKVTRDTIMQQLHHQHPAYGWNHNAGYGTATHQAAIQQHGITPHHRTSFRPIREFIQSTTHEVAYG